MGRAALWDLVFAETRRQRESQGFSNLTGTWPAERWALLSSRLPLVFGRPGMLQSKQPGASLSLSAELREPGFGGGRRLLPGSSPLGLAVHITQERKLTSKLRLGKRK